MTGIPITNVLGAPISGLILDHVHWLGISSWRWLLILEGLPAVILGVLTYLLLPNRPAEAKFLTESEKDWITTQLNSEEDHKHRTHQLSAAGALLHSRVYCENTIERVLQHGGRIPSDGSERRRFADDDSGFAHVRS